MDTTLLEQEGMYEKWPGLKRIAKMERERTENSTCSRETIYISAAWRKMRLLTMHCVRLYCWVSENKLHWHLDVTFREDMCRVRAKNGAVNFQRCASMHWKCLKSRTVKQYKRRRKMAMWSTEYLYKVFKDS